ncbi:hypothetical protein IPL68_07665 [Candidatus Saccharibacteria bacterium]|nr:MAG: hypothetical protein IPL68_07665 [Candidatus Saccharibacteria bacterium]
MPVSPGRATSFCAGQKEAKNLGQQLQLLAELLFVSTTDVTTPQATIATGNTSLRKTSHATCQKS